MWRWLVVVCLVGCKTPPPVAHPRSVVTVRERRHVVMNISSWSCSNQCTQLLCAIACPTARVSYGECGPDDNRPELHCRNFVDQRTYERDGRCADGEVAGVERLSCVDKKPEAASSSSDDSAGKTIAAVIIGIPLLLLYVVAVGINRT